MPADLAIETHGLTKRFRSQLAVDGLDLAVPRGAVFGFLGPNGSGKTTTIRMLLGLVAASAGDARVLGADMPRHVDSVLPRVGALVEGPAFSPYLSGEANLRRFDAADRHAPRRTRIARVAEALDRVGLSHAARKKVHAYSLGMKQRLGIANALLDAPRAARARRADERARPAGHPRGARAHPLVRRRRHDRVRVEPPARRGGAGVLARRRDERWGGWWRRARSTSSATRARPACSCARPTSALARAVLARLGLALDGSADAGADDATAMRVVRPGSARRSLPRRSWPRSSRRACACAASRRCTPSLEQRFVELTGEGFDVVQ